MAISTDGGGVTVVAAREVAPDATPSDAGQREGHERLAGVVLRHPLVSVFVLALCARLVVTIVVLVVGGTLFEDDATYVDMARSKAAGLDDAWDDWTAELFDATATFAIPLTVAYWIADVDFAGHVVVALAGAGAAAAVTAVGLRTVRRPWAIGAGVAMCLMPSLILWSSLVLKDAFVWLVVGALALTVSLAITTRRSVRALGALMAAGVLLLLIAHLRDHSFVVATYAFVAAAILGAWRRPWIPVLALLFAVALPVAEGMGPLAIDFVRNQGSLEERRLANAAGAETAFIPVPEDISRPEREAGIVGHATPSAGDATDPQPRPGTATSTTAAPTTTTTIADDPIATDVIADLEHLPKGLSVMFLEPYPGAVDGNSRLQLALAEHLLWYPLLVLALVGVVVGIRRRMLSLAFPVLYLLGAALVYALAEGNFGTAYRHRSELMWAVMLAAAVGSQTLVDRRRRVRG